MKRLQLERLLSEASTSGMWQIKDTDVVIHQFVDSQGHPVGDWHLIALTEQARELLDETQLLGQHFDTRREALDAVSLAVSLRS